MMQQSMQYSVSYKNDFWTELYRKTIAWFLGDQPLRTIKHTFIAIWIVSRVQQYDNNNNNMIVEGLCAKYWSKCLANMN